MNAPLPNETKLVPVEPTVEMLIAGRRQCMQDMLGEYHGPNIEKIWRVMVEAARKPERRVPRLSKTGARRTAKILKRINRQ